MQAMKAAVTGNTQPVVKQPIITLRYTGGPPPPHPACTDPRPDVEFEMHVQQKAAQLQQREAAAATASETGSAGGALGKLSMFASSVATKMDKAASELHASGEAKLRVLEHKQAEDRWTIAFPELVASGDVFIVSYQCRVMHQGLALQGELYLSKKHACFLNDTLREAIPLATVASVQRSVALKTIDHGPPFIMPVPAPHVLPECLQLFLTNQQVFQFLDFDSVTAKVGSVVTSSLKGRPIDRAYNYLDHAWRDAVQVPLPDVQYAAY
jgi:hypothetical protein